MPELPRFQFGPEDEEFISSFVQDFVHDPEMIEEATVFRMDLLKHARDLIFSRSPTRGQIQAAKDLMYDARFLGEVVRRARAVRQIMGIDDKNKIDRDTQESGLGSIFDETSPIRQKLDAHFTSKTL